ncbi:hypothetical protein J2M53_15100 [Arthrobacter sp. zg-ZUI100]|uniref:hypothetical protein n=1 Tax=Arthrobacter jiangjiafuii TaxID=2817475 RepID=UPI001AEF0D88|nr:hypothetical protein [Arthrobacter jiangjiafuii]MBP3037571.1 hypothetical protein [Arthrobacter jiangjiafuii]
MACVAIASIALAASVSACAQTPYNYPVSRTFSPPVRPPVESLADAERFVNEMLQKDPGHGSPLTVRNARENTCLDPPIKDDGTNEVTSVRIDASWIFPDAASSEQAMDIMDSYAKSQGWNPAPTDDAYRILEQAIAYEMGDLRFSASNWRKLGNGASYETAQPSDWYYEVEFSVATDCSKQPEDHVLVRSKYDPGYGTSATYYDVEAEREDRADWTQLELSTP